MRTELVLDVAERHDLEPRLDLWSELNRIVQGADAIRKELDAVEAAIPAGGGQLAACVGDLERLVHEVPLARLAHELRPVAGSDRCAQAHEPELWGVYQAALEADHHLAQLMKLARGSDAGDRGAQMLDAAKKAREQLTTAVADGRIVTAPDDVRRALDGQSVGAAAQLDQIFGFLEGDPEATKRFAQRLEHRCRDFFVDAARGVVYKKSTSRWARLATYLAPLAWLVLGAVVVIAPADELLDLRIGESLWAHAGGDALDAYVMVLAGVVMHVLVTAQKQRQSQVGAPLPLGSPLDWLHTRWAGVALTFVWAVVVVYGLGLSGLRPDGAESALLFLSAGYAVDSVAGMFLTRFDPLAQKGLSTLDSQIGGRAAASGA